MIIIIARPYVWWTGRNEIIQEGLAGSSVVTPQSNFNKVTVSLCEVIRDWEELDVGVCNFVCLAIDEVTEVYEHVSVSD